MNLLHSYTNGNTHVSLYDDGTKIREFDGVPKPIHPESFDCKITNYCDGGCRWCHEKSAVTGSHADLSRLLDVIKELPAGVEIALGGGNPLSHPDLLPFLRELKARGLVANMTVNQKHFKPYAKEIRTLIEEGLIHGLGVSYSGTKYQADIAPFVSMTSNMVFHLIMGINSVYEIDDLQKFVKENGGKACKVLVLGYKDYGNGSPHYSLNKEAIDNNKLRWFRFLSSFFKDSNLTLSFDNLAIEQLKLKRFFTEGAWNKFFMGSEGSYTCYVDAVNQQFAVCSVDPNRVSFEDSNLLTFFQSI
jgi:hypothetical protein